MDIRTVNLTACCAAKNQPKIANRLVFSDAVEYPCASGIVAGSGSVIGPAEVKSLGREPHAA